MEHQYLGWTEDPAILAIVEDVLLTEDEQILSNRKDGGVHRVWVWPLGHYDDDDFLSGDDRIDEPMWSRVDICTGRYVKDGCTFLVWDDECCRAGTLEDADWLRRALAGETERTRVREARRQHVKAQLEEHSRPYDFAALLPHKGGQHK